MKVDAADRGVLLFAGVILFLVLLAILAPVVAPYSPDDQDLAKRFNPPLTPGHPLGTDHPGRDIVTRLIFGARISLSVGTIAVLISGTVGTALGVLSGFYGGMLDDMVNLFVNVQPAFPFILLAISVIAVLGASLVNVIIVLAIGGWPAYVRVVRAKVVELKEVEFVEAVRAIGADERIEAALLSIEGEARQDAYNRCLSWLQENPHLLYLNQPVKLFAHRKEVSGVCVDHAGFVGL